MQPFLQNEKKKKKFLLKCTRDFFFFCLLLITVSEYCPVCGVKLVKLG